MVHILQWRYSEMRVSWWCVRCSHECGAVIAETGSYLFYAVGERRSRRNFSIELKDCAQACITLSNYMDLINVPMVALLLKNLILQTVISGDLSRYLTPSSIV